MIHSVEDVSLAALRTAAWNKYTLWQCICMCMCVCVCVLCLCACQATRKMCKNLLETNFAKRKLNMAKFDIWQISCCCSYSCCCYCCWHCLDFVYLRLCVCASNWNIWSCNLPRRDMQIFNFRTEDAHCDSFAFSFSQSLCRAAT